MAELAPHPFGRLVNHAFAEFERNGSIFGLPRRHFFRPKAGYDCSVSFHGRPAGSPLGPAAGPHTQLAQNIVLSWLAGGRILELKTVQINDRLVIPRPCIDMRTVGYNVEWSQELRLEQSLEEYVKASMLIDLLRADARLGLGDGPRPIFDMSVGYDLKGLRSAPVDAFVRGMKDASAVVERLRGELSREAHRKARFETALSDTLTLSTFHGCPPDEIEAMASHVMTEWGLHCTVKLNPTLLGYDEVHRLLHGALGYEGVRCPREAFDKDATWEQVLGFTRRLAAKAKGLSRGFGAKFTNTLVVENPGDFLPAAEKLQYLSGAPLHVLAMSLVARFRREFGPGFTISFSGGVTRHNFPDAAALGLTPVTVCSDLLGPGGYGRLAGYYEELYKRMDAVGARTIPELVARAGGGERPRDEAVLANTEAYVSRLPSDPRYHRARNATPPRKVGSSLALFDCLTCDKCVPVCPNDANFTYALEAKELPVVVASRRDGRWDFERKGVLKLEKKHQLANYADFCNECGNCDVFCPEDGGPYVVKPRFFGSVETWRADKGRDGFFVGPDEVRGRFAGREYRLGGSGARREYEGPGFKLAFDAADPEGTLSGTAESGADLTYWRIMENLRTAVLSPAAVNYLNDAGS